MTTNLIPRFPEPVPSKTQTVEDFNNSMFGMAGNLNPFVDGTNAAVDYMNAQVANVQAITSGNADLMWVSGQTYTKGQVRWSPIDFMDYRRKTDGSGTTDPANDPTNWVLKTKTAFGGSDIHTSASDVVLTNLDPRFHLIAMTAAGQRVKLPAANTMQKGVNIFEIKNAGGYRFAVIRSDQTFLCFVYPGQSVSVHLSDTSTAVGKWHAFGNNLQNIYDMNAPVQLLNAASSSFDAAMLTATKGVIAYRKDSDGKLYARTVNVSAAPGAETPIGADANITNVSMDALSATQFAVTYRFGNIIRVRVVDVSGDTLTVGGSVDVVNTTPNANFKITRTTAASSTKLLVHWLAYSSSYIYFAPVTISGSTPSAGAVVTSTVVATYIYVKKINSTKFIVSSVLNDISKIHLQSDAALTGSSVSTNNIFDISDSTESIVSFCKINESIGLLFISANGISNDNRICINVIDTSALTPVIIRAIYFDVKMQYGIAARMSSVLVDANNTVYVSWAGAIGGGIDGITLQYTNDGDIRFGVIADRIESNVSATDNSVINVALDATTVMQFARKTTPEIVCKTIRIADITDSSQIATVSTSSLLLGGGVGGGAGADGNTAFIRYATDSVGTGFTDIPGTNSHVAIVSLPPDTIPTVEHFVGQWHKWDGPPGNGIIYGDIDPTFEIGNPGDTYVNKTTSTVWWDKSSDPAIGWGTGVNLKGDQGLTGGFNYMLGASTVAENPGPGWMRFNSTTFGLTTLTEFYVSSTTKQGQNIIDILASLNIDDSLMYQPATTGTEILYVSVIGVTANNSGAWYTISIEYKGGNSLTAFKEYTMNFAKVFGLKEVLQNKVLRRDTGNNIIDENGNIIGGVMSGTYATMAALSPAGYVREYYHVINYGENKGIRYFSNGTEWVADGKQRVYDGNPIFKAIFPNTQATAVLNNGGKTQITAVTHLLTAGVAVNATEPISVYISAWTGTGTAGWYKILSVDDVDKYTIDLNYNAANGTPTVTLKNTQVNTPITFSLPPLNNYSKFEIEYIFEFTASTTGKNVITKLGATTFSQITTNATGITLSGAKVGFRNISAKNKQESISGISTLEPEGNTTSAIVKMTEDTSVSSTITVVVSAVTANEVVGVRHITCYLEG